MRAQFKHCQSNFLSFKVSNFSSEITNLAIIMCPFSKDIKHLNFSKDIEHLKRKRTKICYVICPIFKGCEIANSMDTLIN